MPTSIDFRKQRHDLLKRLASKRGGSLQARDYVGGHLPLTIRCANGHRFQLTAKNLMRGLWCSRCRPLDRQSQFLALAQKHAHKHGGKLLSDKYETARTLLEWQCESRHKWKASYDNVINKESWCPTCAKAGMSDVKRKWWRQQKMGNGKRNIRRR